MDEVLKLCESFVLEGRASEAVPFGNGYINSTWLVNCADTGKRYILQRINDSVFHDVDKLMENILLVTGHIREKGGNTLTVRFAADGKPYIKTDEGFFRVYDFVEDTVAIQSARPESLYAAAKGFGEFGRMLGDFDAGKLYETIPGFHDTEKRVRDFEKALERDAFKRAEAVRKETEFILQRKFDASVLKSAVLRGEIPLRVTHNDTKLNNVLFDLSGKKAICVVDLDTVMPGLVHYDFGDGLRSGAASGADDERDLDRIYFDLELFKAFSRGYLEACAGILNENEKKLLAFSAKIMTYECGVRFLTDYLSGDVYFATSRPGQNFDRCRTQLKLVADIEKKMPEMQEIIEKYSKI